MKYPRTKHLPWSPGTTTDDKKIDSIEHLFKKNVIISEKLDGENTSMYCDRIHARSADSGYHASRSWVKGYWGELAHKIPENIQIVGENMYAKHSIYYNNLKSYFYGFMTIENDKTVLSWDDTLVLFKELGIVPIPILCFGPLTPGFAHARLIKPTFSSMAGSDIEGYVIRPLDSFSIDSFDINIVKYVRENHVKTDKHWTKRWSKNDLRVQKY